MTDLLIPGLTCATMHVAARTSLLVDGRDCYKAAHDACYQAERTIVMAGFDSDVPLLGEDAAARVIRRASSACSGFGVRPGTSGPDASRLRP